MVRPKAQLSLEDRWLTPGPSATQCVRSDSNHQLPLLPSVSKCSQDSNKRGARGQKVKIWNQQTLSSPNQGRETFPEKVQRLAVLPPPSPGLNDNESPRCEVKKLLQTAPSFQHGCHKFSQSILSTRKVWDYTAMYNEPSGPGLWGGKAAGGSRGRGHMYTYGWFMLMYGRKQHNIRK